MQDDPSLLCPIWEQEPLPPFPHSQLYHLEPRGRGSPLVESVTSYVTRLADEHSIPPSALVRKQILPRMQRPSFYRDGHLVDSLHLLGQPSVILNGLTSTTHDVVAVLEQLTMRRDLHLLTMLPYREVLSSVGLLRRAKAWCPICYEEWRETGQSIYEPLLWMLSVVTLCPKHHQPLQWSCSNSTCGREQFPLTARGQPGYCFCCNQWLGATLSKTPSEVEHEERRDQLLTAEMVGALLAAISQGPYAPEFRAFASTISGCVDMVTEGSVSELAHLLQTPAATVRQWLHGRKIPQLRTLVKIATLLGTSVLHLLVGEIAQINKPSAGRQKISLEQSRKQRRVEPLGVAKNRQREALCAVIRSAQYPPPSMREVARRLQFDLSGLYKSCPDLCQIISARFANYRAEKRAERIQRLCEETRQAISLLHAQGRYPSQSQVSKRLSAPGSFWVPEVHQTWKEMIQQLGWQQ